MPETINPYDFTARHIGPDEQEIQRMLEALGLKSLSQLTEQTVPASIRSARPLRLPPAACGLEGQNPGRGVVASGESSGDPARLGAAGPLSRSSADAALMMDARAASPG